MEKLQGWVEQGNTTLTIGQAAGVIARKVQGSYPGATITAYLNNPSAVGIVTIQRVVPTFVVAVTVTSPLGSSFIAGQLVTIAGVTDASFNGTFTILGSTATQIFYAQVGAPATSSGGTASSSLRLAQIYSDNALSPTAKANPFVSSSDGTWFFYAANGHYDVKFSGAGITAPFTLGDFFLNDGTIFVVDVTQPPYNAVGDGIVDDSTAINNALNSGAKNVVLPARTYNIGSTTITVPSTCKSFWMMPGSLLTYTGTSIGVLFDTHNGGFELEDHRVAIKKTVADWDPATGTGTDTTSIGVQILNGIHVGVEVAEVQNFATGYQLYGNVGGCTHNQIRLGYIGDNKVGLHHRLSGGGFTNQNEYYGGQIRINSGQTTQLSGSRYIQLDSGSDNMNLFVNINIENAKAERSLSCAGNENFFLNLRYEANQANAGVITGSFNMVIGGYIDSGVWTTVFTTGSFSNGNFFFGALGGGLRMDTAGGTGVNFFNIGDTGTSILNFRGSNRKLTVGASAVSGIIETLLLTSGLTHLDCDQFFRVTAAGGFSMGSDTGKLRIDTAGAGSYPFRFFNASNVSTGMRFAGYINSARAQNALGANVASANDMTLGSDGNFFQITGGVTLNRIATSDWQGGSVIILRFSTTTTVTNGAATGGGFSGLRLEGNNTIIVGNRDVLCFAFNANTGEWDEIARDLKSYAINLVTAANDLTLSKNGNNLFNVSGATQINGISTATWREGDVVTLNFSSTPTVKNNTAASAGFASLRLAGAVDFAATALDTLTLVNSTQTGFWVEIARSVN